MICPKCDTRQTLSSICGQCGIPFDEACLIPESKAEKARPVFGFESFNVGADETRWNNFGFLFPRTVHRILQARDTLRERLSVPWQPVSTRQMLCLSGGFLAMLYLLATRSMLGTDSLVLDMVHNVNLVFHEAGHWIFAVFGNVMFAIFGGTLNQIMIPLIVTGAFWRNRDTVGYAFGLFWCFENFLDVAFYMANARALALPLLGDLGKDGHDWHTLFSQFGLLEQDTLIAAKTRLLGWFGMLATWAWFLERWWIGRKSD